MSVCCVRVYKSHKSSCRFKIHIENGMQDLLVFLHQYMKESTFEKTSFRNLLLIYYMLSKLFA